MHSSLQPENTWTPSGNGPQSGTGIPRTLRRRLEALTRCDLSAVQLHIDPSLSAAGALAAAAGGRVHLSPQAPGFDTAAGVAVLAHELAHVMQQRQGRSRVPQDGLAVVEDTVLEDEACQAGLHCAAKLFPGSVSDPGMPAALRGGAPSQAGSGGVPVQFFVTAQQSYADIVVKAYGQFAQAYNTGHFLGESGRNSCERMLRNLCYSYRETTVHEKQPLTGAAFCDAMNALLDDTKDALVIAQRLDSNTGWPYLPLDRTPLKTYFGQRADGFKKYPAILTWPPLPNIGVLTREAAIAGTAGTESLAMLRDTYLHVFRKEGPPVPVTWRISLNVCPEGIHPAVAGSVPVLAAYPCISEMKFAVPAVTNKPDSVIFYTNNADGSFSEAREKILQLASTLPLQARSGAMLNEVADGVGEGAEAPSAGGANDYYASFTEVRSRVFYVAFNWMFKYVPLPECAVPAYLDALNWVMPCLGLDPANPHVQQPFEAWTKGAKADLVRLLYLNKVELV